MVYFGAARMDDVHHRQYPTSSQPELYSVPVTGGKVDQFTTLPVEYVDFSKDGKTMLYHDKKGGENIWRKHHVSAITRDIWQYDVANDTHTMITSFNGEDRRPIFTADEKGMYYLSEESGSFNIHKKDLSLKAKSKQITNYTLHPVRFLSMGNGILSYGYDGELYTMKEGEQPKKVNVDITTQEISNSDKYISVNGDIKEMEVSPSGKEIAFIARGEVFVTSVDNSITKRITNTPEAERFVTWGPEGKSVVYSSERNGNWSIYKSEIVSNEEPFFFAATLVKETAVLENGKDNYLPKFSPDGKKMAFIEERRTLKVRDMNSGEDKALLTPEDLFHMSDGDKYFTWSPDSKWLLVDWSKSLSNSEVLLMAADGSKRINLTESGYRDVYPKWTNGGKQMLWMSNRHGLKSYATSGQSQLDVYSMFFTQEVWDNFNLSKEDYELKEQIEKLAQENKKDGEKEKDKSSKKKSKEKNKEEVKDTLLSFDWDRMKDYTKRLTIHSSSLSDAVLSKDAKTLYYLARFEDKLNLWSTNLRTKETKMAIKLGARSGSLQWDRKMENLYLLSSGKISKIDLKSNKKEGVKINSEMEFDAQAERQAMFDHVWIRTNAIFYHPNFHGIDWNLMKEEYSRYIPHVGNAHEFAEVLSEMLGELNVSHAGARGRSHDVKNADETGALGIFFDYKHDGNGILITEIIKDGPLDKSKFNVKSGMIIKSINGKTIDTNRDHASLLNRTAGKFTLLELLDPTTGKSSQITMKPITQNQQNRLLYKRWVKINEEEVNEKSNGQLGYVHIPGMSDGPYRSIYQDMMGKYFERKGIIVDTRFNGGGDLVADLAMFFTGEPFISYETEEKVVGGEPTSRWTKPTLAIFNESMYSDGHCFASGYTDLNIGKTVGMPVPGTCSFAGWESLPNGTYWGVVPVSAKDKQGDWMENNQTEPQIRVKNMPGMINKNIDQQLDRSIRELMQDVK